MYRFQENLGTYLVNFLVLNTLLRFLLPLKNFIGFVSELHFTSIKRLVATVFPLNKCPIGIVILAVPDPEPSNVHPS